MGKNLPTLNYTITPDFKKTIQPSNIDKTKFNQATVSINEKHFTEIDNYYTLLKQVLTSNVMQIAAETRSLIVLSCLLIALSYSSMLPSEIIHYRDTEYEQPVNLHHLVDSSFTK